jgi:hypothetical protein
MDSTVGLVVACLPFLGSSLTIGKMFPREKKVRQFSSILSYFFRDLFFATFLVFLGDLTNFF